MEKEVSSNNCVLAIKLQDCRLTEFFFRDPMKKESKVKIYDSLLCVIYKVIAFIRSIYICNKWIWKPITLRVRKACECAESQLRFFTVLNAMSLKACVFLHSSFLPSFIINLSVYIYIYIYMQNIYEANVWIDTTVYALVLYYSVIHLIFLYHNFSPFVYDRIRNTRGCNLLHSILLPDIKEQCRRACMEISTFV